MANNFDRKTGIIKAQEGEFIYKIMGYDLDREAVEKRQGELHEHDGQHQAQKR